MTHTKEVAFITGAASGIGKQIGETFLKEGKTVVFSDINKEKLDEVVAEYTNEGYDAFSVVCDVTKEEAINSAIDTVVEKYGRLDILVNNAGLQHVAMIEDFPTEKFEFRIKIMLTAPFIAIKRAFPTMKAQKHGRIINMASINGVIGFAGKSAYL
ncbi:hypothetical protein SDSE159_15580 [Streptococcus dysgalactiae subsp. equisimilis]|nr:hypothetical protein SDSE159_15580 [Streptococcus dysgalactiae subsp. equisimilis]